MTDKEKIEALLDEKKVDYDEFLVSGNLTVISIPDLVFTSDGEFKQVFYHE